WSLDVSADLGPAVDPSLGEVALEVRGQIFGELGVPLPMPRVRVRGELDARCIVLSLHEGPAPILRVPAVPDDELAAWGRAPLLETVRAGAADFVNMAEVQRLLDQLESFAPATVRNVVPKPVSLVLLTDILRRLVEERFSVRDLRGILEALSMVAATE